LQVFIIGRTIPSFRIATGLEEKEWDNFRKYLNINNSNKNHYNKTFKEMLSIENLYNSACSNAVNPIRIHPIMMSILLHHYKIINERELEDDHDNDNNNDINDYNNNFNSTVLKRELDKWYKFSFVLRKKNRILFEEMLRSSYKYLRAIEVRGKKFYRILFDIII
jgi:hypothetical protein